VPSPRRLAQAGSGSRTGGEAPVTATASTQSRSTISQPLVFSCRLTLSIGLQSPDASGVVLTILKFKYLFNCLNLVLSVQPLESTRAQNARRPAQIHGEYRRIGWQEGSETPFLEFLTAVPHGTNIVQPTGGSWSR
jgi:hypothetical protein